MSTSNTHLITRTTD